MTVTGSHGRPVNVTPGVQGFTETILSHPAAAVLEPSATDWAGLSDPTPHLDFEERVELASHESSLAHQLAQTRGLRLVESLNASPDHPRFIALTDSGRVVHPHQFGTLADLGITEDQVRDVPFRRGAAPASPSRLDQLIAEAELTARDLRTTDYVKTPVRPGVLDGYASHAYLTGQCLALAVAIAEAKGWQVTVAADGGTLAHAWAKAPDGQLLDIEGAHDRDRVLDDNLLDDDDLVDMDPKTAFDTYALQMPHQDTAMAETFVAPVTANAGY